MKSTYFKLDLNGISLWQREIINGKEFYQKIVLEEKEENLNSIIIDRVKKDCFLDLITGRPVYITKNTDNETITIYPSGIIVSRTSLKNITPKEAYNRWCMILDLNLEEEYSKISEELIYNGYLCENLQNKNSKVKGKTVKMLRRELGQDKK